MSKPSIAELLNASGHTTYTFPWVLRAMYALYGNVGANLDERDWSAIMQSSNPLATAETGLLAMYQDGGYLLRNTQHLVQAGYVAAQAEFTYRQMAERLGFAYSPDWSLGTGYEYLGALSNGGLIALVPGTSAPSPLPTILVASSGAGFTVTVNVAGTVAMSVSGSLGGVAAGDTLLAEQGSIKQGFLTLASNGNTSAATSQYVVLGTAGEDTIDTSAVAGQVDFILGGSGNDTIHTGLGNDTITGGDGVDSLFGGDGDDLFWYADNLQLREDSAVAGGDGMDTIAFSMAIDTLSGVSAQGDNFHADFDRVTSIERIQLFGVSLVNLGDALLGAGVTTIATGNDDTTLRYDSIALGALTIDATALADNKTLILTQFGGPGAGQWFDVTGLQGNVNAAGLQGDIAVAAATGNGFDVAMVGGNGNDRLTGGEGSDTLTGGPGSDTIQGGAGCDTCVYESSSDSTISDLPSLATGFDTVSISSGDIFDFALDVTSVRTAELYVGNVPQANGNALLAQINHIYQTGGPSAGIDAMYISIGNNDKGRFLVMDVDDNNQITGNDLIIEIVGITDNKHIELILMGGNVVMNEVDPPFGP